MGEIGKVKIKSNSIVDVDLTDKIVVLKEQVLTKQYRTLENRLWKATGGFGCHPGTIGSTVFSTCLGDGQKTRWQRGHFEGWLTEEQLNELLLKEKSITTEQFMAWQRLAVKDHSDD